MPTIDVLTLDQPVERRLHSLLRQRQPRETGGLLLGWRDPSGVVVVDIIETPDEYATGGSWTMRHAGAQRMLDDYCRDLPLDSPIGYVGTWHTHPRPDPTPSALDVETFTAEAIEAESLVAMLICSSNRELTAMVGARDLEPAPTAVDVADLMDRYGESDR